jgi:hypothetical protein
MFELSASDGGTIVLLSLVAVGAAALAYRYFTRTTPISSVHTGKEDTCKGKFDREIVRARARRLQGPPVIDIKNLPAPDARVAAVLGTVNVADVTKGLNELTGEVDTVVAGQTVRITSRSTHNPMLWTAMALLEQEYAKLGIPTRRIKYTVRGKTLYNLEATITGATHPEKIVIVGSHLDSTAGATHRSENVAPGADDDGSGSRACLHVARAIVDLQKAGMKVGNTIRFLHFTGEEQGLWGSYTYSDLVAAAKEEILGVYQIDMIGWCAKKGNRVDIHDDVDRNGSHSLVAKLVRNVARYKLDLNPVDTHDRAVHNRSDQAGFLDHGYKAVLISEEFTDTGFNPNYHSTNDRVKTLNIPYMIEIIKMVIATVVDDADMK